VIDVLEQSKMSQHRVVSLWQHGSCLQ